MPRGLPQRTVAAVGAATEDRTLTIVADLDEVSPEEIGRVIHVLERLFGHELVIRGGSHSPPGGGLRRGYHGGVEREDLA